MRPGFYLDKYNSVTFTGYYINFPASCPPVAGDKLPTFGFKGFRDKILAISADRTGCAHIAGIGHFGFWYSEGSIARAIKRFRFERRSMVSPSFAV